MNPAERILVAAVTNPDSPCDTPASDVLDRIEQHRLAPQAWDTITRAGHAAAWPEQIRSKLRHVSAAHAVASEMLDRELRVVIDAAGGSGVRSVLIKGAALAYTHYRRPYLRPRNDSDVVIDEADRDAMADVLSSLGYARSAAVEGTLITQQAQWTRTGAAGLTHAVDVHWRLFNPHLFGRVLSTDRLLERAVPLPALGPHASSPCAVDALMIACVHRVAHHAGEEDVVWDFDIHLLVSALREEEAAEFAAAVAAAELRNVAAAGIGSAQTCYGTRIPPPLAELVEHASRYREPTAVFLERGRRQVDLLRSDLATLPGWRARTRLMREHLFPSREYMRSKYGARSGARLALAYARRIVRGVPRWLRSQRS